MKAVFLDRDGTIIQEPSDERVDSVEKIKLFPDTIEALNLLSSLDYKVFVITNQAGIAEGRISENEFWRIHDKILQMLKPSGIHIEKTYMCPHVESDHCICRKPQPTLILQAAEDFYLDLQDSWMVGDRLSDVLAGRHALTKTIAVQTGVKPVHTEHVTHKASNLLEAIRFIAAEE